MRFLSLLEQNQEYSKASSFHAGKMPSNAITGYSKVLTDLEQQDNTPILQLQIAYIHRQIARCFAQRIIRRIFKDDKPALISINDLWQGFNAHIDLARAAIKPANKSCDASKLNKDIATAHILFKEQFVRHALKHFIENKTGLISRLPSDQFDSLVNENLENLENFANHYHAILAKPQDLIIKALALLADAAHSFAGKHESIDWYRNAIQVLDQALEKVRKYAMVKPAELLFDKWAALIEITKLSENKAEKIAAYQAIIDEQENCFGGSDAEDNDYYHYRPSEYAYSLKHSELAHNYLAELKDNAAEKSQHVKKAQEFETTFKKLFSLIDPQDLSKKHMRGLMTTMQGSLCSKRLRTAPISYRDHGSESEDESESKNEAKSSSSSLPAVAHDSDFEEGDDEPLFKKCKTVKRLFSSSSSSSSSSSANPEPGQTITSTANPGQRPR